MLEYTVVREFLVDLKKKFGEGDDKKMKVAELKKIEQESRTMEDFVQKFRRTARRSKYKRKSLVEEFKQGINEMIRRKLIEVERPFKSIEQ